VVDRGALRRYSSCTLPDKEKILIPDRTRVQNNLLKRWVFALATVTFFAVWGTVSAIGQRPNATETIVRVSAHGEGRVFDGIGAVSAGASSRLLVDYPEPQRSEILDYLFKPNFGASLQHLKVEIGADVNSTDGSEPSHERERGVISATRGYEWWLMKEARRRNPAIVLDSLAWGAPSWIGNGRFYSHDMAEYIADFLKMGRDHYGMEIAYTGIWNEKKPDYSFVKDLRKTLDQRGLRTKIVCCDLYSQEGSFDIVQAMQTDTELAHAVDVVGVHYPFEGIPQLSPAFARNPGMTLWSSEDQPNPGAGPYLTRDWEHGGRILAKRYNENYLKGRLTSTEIWSPVTAYYDVLAAPHSGLMVANTPWSAAYEVPAAIWVTAHTTQFAKPGWRYVDGASGMLTAGGTFVTLRAPAGIPSQWSTVVETIDAKAPQTAVFKLDSDVSSSSVYVWKTSKNVTFRMVEKIVPRRRELHLTLDPDAIYTITTTTGQGRGTTSIPPAKSFPMPWYPSLPKESIGHSAPFLADQNGAFEIQGCSDKSSYCLKQVITKKPIPWGPMPDPYTLAGDLQMADYQISADVSIRGSGSASLLGRIDSADAFRDQKARYPAGYVLTIQSDGVWSLLCTRYKHEATVLTSGKTTPTRWMQAGLRFHGTRIGVFLGKKEVAHVEDSIHAKGYFAVGTGWNQAEFRHLALQAP